MPSFSANCTALTWVSCLLAFLACSSDSEPGTVAPAAQNGPYDTCTVDADCGYGEIDSELTSRSQCTCLYGCDYLPLNRETIERRRQQHQALCVPGKDGHGQECGVDDCARAPVPACIAGKCGAASSN